jgi:hypothetical protein
MSAELAADAAVLSANVAELRLDRFCRVRGAQGPAHYPRQAAPAPRPRHLQVRPAPPGPTFWDCDDAIQLDWRIMGFQRLSAWSVQMSWAKMIFCFIWMLYLDEQFDDLVKIFQCLQRS